MKILTKKQILKLKPEFKYGYQNMVDWFEITQGDSFISIKNGLRHADTNIKSPYYYEELTMGKNHVKTSLVKFSEWWKIINKID